MKETTKRAISYAQKMKWASGTRKKNPDGYGKKGGEKRKAMMADGRMRKRITTPDQAREYVAHRDPEKMAEINRRLGKERIGVEMKTPLSAKGPDHHKARYWVVKNAALGVTLKGWNLNDLVRNNAELFDERDTNWNGHKCRATRGLRSLFEIRKKTGRPQALSWKGWMPVDVTDKGREQ